ncbi:MAG TPA: sigma-70 family RNA polymerase sigma factor, partial [Burkholderiales bacterium]|nr:sigma-70 family RNA polymerase sigma factor [Burkholderiales bacterium]
MDREPADEALMLRYRDGDAGAFEALYGRHRGPLFRYFLRQWRDRSGAEEMFQDVWTGVIRSRARYRPSAKFTTWLYRMAHNRLMDEYRRRGGAQPLSFDDPDGGVPDPPAPLAADPARQAENREQAALLRTALEALPEAQREAFLLHEEGGLSLEEIAAAT